MSYIYTTTQRGYLHAHFCEDFCLAISPNPDWFFGVVSDGCSSGDDSHFASVLSCKILKKLIYRMDLQQHTIPKIVVNNLLHSFIADFRKQKEELDLEPLELLATILLLAYHVPTKQAYIAVLGDGIVNIDEVIHEIDQRNVPDYPAYHLNDKQEELDKYFAKNTFEANNPIQLAISTDGVVAFKNETNALDTDELKAANFLLLDRNLYRTTNMLSRKINILRSEHHLVPADDVAIVRIILEI
jgi:hypothetical protein